jgi:hypothetical protein
LTSAVGSRKTARLVPRKNLPDSGVSSELEGCYVTPEERFLLRNAKSRNDVWILFEANSLSRAKAFCASADLRVAMKKAGVTGKPELAILADA